MLRTAGLAIKASAATTRPTADSRDWYLRYNCHQRVLHRLSANLWLLVWREHVNRHGQLIALRVRGSSVANANCRDFSSVIAAEIVSNRASPHQSTQHLGLGEDSSAKPTEEMNKCRNELHAELPLIFRLMSKLDRVFNGNNMP